MERLARRIHIRSQQPIVNEYLDLLPVEPQCALQTRFGLQQLASAERGDGRLRQALLISAVEHGFAVIANSHAVIGVVHAVVGFVADQHDPRPGGHVAVIGDVEQQLRTRAILNPAVKYRNQPLEAGVAEILDEEFYIDVLQFMRFVRLALDPAAGVPMRL